MRVRSVKLRAGEELLRTIVVKPPLTRFETRDYRVTRSGLVFRCMLIWRTITASDVPAFGASAEMEPPSAQSQAFDATCSARLDCWVDTISPGFHRLLSDFLLLQLSASRSLQRHELIHHTRNKLRHPGMNVHRALYHRVGALAYMISSTQWMTSSPSSPKKQAPSTAAADEEPSSGPHVAGM
jgi:hypothetical protein